MKIACDCTRCKEYHKKIIGMTDVNSLNTETRVKAQIREEIVKLASINGMILREEVLAILSK